MHFRVMVYDLVQQLLLDTPGTIYLCSVIVFEMLLILGSVLKEQYISTLLQCGPTYKASLVFQDLPDRTGSLAKNTFYKKITCRVNRVTICIWPSCCKENLRSEQAAGNRVSIRIWCSYVLQIGPGTYSPVNVENGRQCSGVVYVSVQALFFVAVCFKVYHY